MNSIYGKRGRPKGAKTKSTTVGKKRARDYLDFRFENELGPTEAASFIAEKYGIEVCQAFKDIKRHKDCVALDVWGEAEIAERGYVHLLALTVGPRLPCNSRVLTAWIIATTLKGQRI